MNNFKAVIKKILEAEIVEGGLLENFTIYKSVKADKKSYPFIALESCSEEIKADKGSYNLTEGMIEIVIAADRKPAGSWEDATEFITIYTKVVKQILRNAGRLITTEYPDGFLAPGHYKVNFPELTHYYYYNWESSKLTASAEFPVSAKYFGTI